MNQDISKLISLWLKTAKKTLLVILGPTASGKTKLAVTLAKQFDGEVINADSRQIYSDFKIGTALPTEEEREGVSHHLFAILPVSEIMTVADYKKLADRAIQEILSRKKIPILCGGTFLWTDAVIDNFPFPKGEPDYEFRKNSELMSIDELLTQLSEVDPESAIRLKETKNKRYLIRALEIFHQTGRQKSRLAKKGRRKYDVLKIAPLLEREELYLRINQRTEEQLNRGLIDEVKSIADRYAASDINRLMSFKWPGLTTIGCKEVIPYLNGSISREELLKKLQQHNRNYAKRQMTWLRKDSEIHWIKL